MSTDRDDGVPTASPDGAQTTPEHTIQAQSDSSTTQECHRCGAIDPQVLKRGFDDDDHVGCID